MKNKLLICITVMMLALTLGGCFGIESYASESETVGVVEKSLYRSGLKSVSVIKDPYTNVEYIVVYINGTGIGITPRLNPDGSLCIGE